MEISNEVIGNRIRKLREIKGLTREQLAEFAEISANFLWEIETGRKSMKVLNLAKLAEALNTSTDYLVFGTTKCNGNEKISALLSAMPENIQEQLEKMIDVFLDTVCICKSEVKDNNKSDGE